ncbi:MAG TPA: ClpXP protease specificity-enhancing factor [Rhodocyclaceae bacterium]|nr:ClpXP protease specificity-enhancing factor [Rhodocyclaceae bacterium]
MPQTSAIASTKPYLIRAIHEWCLDQNFTPYLVAKIDTHVRVPREYAKDGQIVLNLGLEATHQLSIGNEIITFSARFNGVAQTLSVPIENVVAIYARENGQGMAFEMSSTDGVAIPVDETDTVSGTSESTATDEVHEPVPPPSGRPTLTRIK